MFEFGENLVRLRKSKGITQEQLAEFVGVTKASVSKWETKQSMPDIGMLPLLSSYFDVSIDSLLGYHPKLSKEEIEQIYEELAGKFAREPFEMAMKESEEVVDSLKVIADPLNLSAQSENILIQAYQAKGDTEMAERYSQLHLYNDVLGIISHSTLYLTNNIDNEPRCEETIERVLEVMKTYHFLKVNPNTSALFFLQAATVYATYDRKEQFFQMLEKYVDAIYALFEKELVLIQGDSYFDKLEIIIEQRRETKQAPRDKKVIFQSAMSMFEYPLFLKYKDEEMNILTLNHVSKSFGSKQVVKDLSFEVPEHIVYGFIGKNGAGKTTTMKMILGLVKMDEGEIKVNGSKVTFGQNATNQYIGYLPDVPEYYGYMTPREYLKLCGRITGMTEKEIQKKSVTY